MKPINLPVFVVIGLPVMAVVASTLSAIIAVRGQDPQLPEQYHWEGQQLDQDFARAQHAAELGVRARLSLNGLDGRCYVDLQIQGAPPARLELALIHGAHSELDQHWSFAPGRRYEAVCMPLPNASWHIELSDSARTWSVRRDVQGVLDEVELSAQGP